MILETAQQQLGAGRTTHSACEREEAPRLRNSLQLVLASLVECRLETGRTHQIRVHLAHTAAPVLGDALYGKAKRDEPLALRSILLAYRDPFTRRPIAVKAPVDEFLKMYKLSAHETGFNEWKT